MGKLFKIFFIFISVCLVVLSFFYYGYLQSQKEQAIKKYFDFNSELMARSLENERLNALAISILLSKSNTIKNCYITQNHDVCMNIAKEFIDIIAHIPKYKDVNIHMHNADIISLARSWDDTKFGDNLSSFRYMLNDIKNNMQPLSGIEVGRCGMFIRGISPVFLDNKFAGSVEVMLNFSALDDVAKNQGLNIFILLDKSFDSDCIQDIDKNLLKNHYILNQNILNVNLLPNLRRFDYENQKFARLGDNYFYSKPLIDISNNEIGYIVLHYNDNVISTSRLERILN